MQQFLLAMFFMAVAMFSTVGNITAQCTPPDSLAGGAIIDPLPFTEENPENGLRDTACVDTEFETFIYIAVPDTVDLGALGQLPIDSAMIIEPGITGVPAGFSYECGTPDCVFYPNEVGCIRIFGTPVAGEEGMFNLEVAVRIMSGIFPLDRTLPDPTLAPGEYRLFVRENGNAACAPSSINELSNEQFALTLAPNPSRGEARLTVQSLNAGTARLSVVDAVGRVVKNHSLALQPGENIVRLSTDDLDGGLYTLLLQNESGGVSTRWVVLP